MQGLKFWLKISWGKKTLENQNYLLLRTLQICLKPRETAHWTFHLTNEDQLTFNNVAEKKKNSNQLDHLNTFQNNIKF